MSFLAEDPDADADAHSPVSSLIISDALGNSLITYFPGSRFESGTIAKTVATIGAMSPRYATLLHSLETSTEDQKLTLYFLPALIYSSSRGTVIYSSHSY